MKKKRFTTQRNVISESWGEELEYENILPSDPKISNLHNNLYNNKTGVSQKAYILVSFVLSTQDNVSGLSVSKLKSLTRTNKLQSGSLDSLAETSTEYT